MIVPEDQQEVTREVWGIPVPCQANGRYLWPGAIKDRAVERIRDGETVASLAMEIGANPSLVAKWASDARKDGAAPQGARAFVEVVACADATPKAIGASAEASCDIFLGDVRLAITPAYPAAHLAEILRAVRVSQ